MSKLIFCEKAQRQLEEEAEAAEEPLLKAHGQSTAQPRGQSSEPPVGLPVTEPVAGLPLETRPEGFGTLPFRTGVFDVCADGDICCYGTFCTPCLYGENEKKLQELEGQPDSSCVGPCLNLWCASAMTSMATFVVANSLGLAAVGGAAATPAAALGASRFANHLSDIAGNCMGASITSKSRKKLRSKFGLAENPHVSDFWIHYWCRPCAICQEAREIRGFMRDAAAQRELAWAQPVIGAPEAQVMRAPQTAEGYPAEYEPDSKPMAM